MSKFITLIIDSDKEPIYQVGREIWRRNAAKNNCLIYFLRASPDITDDSIYIDGDTIYSKWDDSFLHRLNDKTLKAYQYCIATHEFDYILRSNLSSYYRLDILLEYLNGMPTTCFYGGSIMDINLIVEGGTFFPLTYNSGSGFILSKDLVELLLQKKNNLPIEMVIDDVWTGFTLLDIPRHEIARCDLTDFDDLTLDNILRIQQRIISAEKNNTFHFRIKNSGSLPRYILDISVFSLLTQKFLT